MNIPFTSVRYRAFYMKFITYPDDQCVEMKVLTDKGLPVTVLCDQDSILSMQNYIRKMLQSCPEISTWSAYDDVAGGFQDNVAGS